MPVEAPLPIPPEGAFLIIDKPRGPSSHQVTAWVRDLLGATRAGHAGTLDPGVSGVLVVAVGPALRLLPLLLRFPKHYIAVVTFHGQVRNADLERVIGEFTGPIFQTPPVRSAVRRERRIRTIHKLALLERAGTSVLLDIQADSGTYVRTLAVDMGEALGPGGNMAELRRIGTGPFTEAAATTVTALADAVHAARAGHPEAFLALLHSPQEAWRAFPQVVVKDSAVDALAHGADLAAPGVLKVSAAFKEGDLVVLTTRRDELVGLGRAVVASSELASTKEGWVVDARQVFMAPGRYPARWGAGARTAEARGSTTPGADGPAGGV